MSFDTTCRRLAEIFPEDFASWLLGYRVPLTELSLTFPRKSGHSRRVDKEGECSDESKTPQSIYRRAKGRSSPHRQSIR
ncbi:MAG: hypothetical protein HC936_00960 [Leptolyngbyaceae cyanobacterium SU_3_3]|nr:hypothetical protein [Leptolyngbyaceae cyanobacterium SU_3_3]